MQNLSCKDKICRLTDNIITIYTEVGAKNPALMVETDGLITEVRFEFTPLLNCEETNNFENGFRNYLKNDPNVNLQDADYEEALNYIRQHMEAGVGLWTESSVIEQLKNWKLSLIPVVTQNQPSPHDNNTNNHEVNVVDSQSLTSKHTKAKERIKSLTMDEAREILDDLCDLRIDSVLNIILK